MNIVANVNLADKNTLGISCIAEYFSSLSDINEVADLASWAREKKLPFRVLGSGSNVVLPSSLPGLTVGVELLGKKVLSEDDESVLVSAMAGENWHSFVAWALENQFFGIENLALIPGTVGAAPVQNIGAYGVEIGDFLTEVKAFDLLNDELVVFNHEGCEFGYRDSLFKRSPGQFLIVEVLLRLNKKFNGKLDYGPLKTLATNPKVTAKEVFHRVIETRQQKLPDPTVMPNAGSFFKNPVVSKSFAAALEAKYPDLVQFPVEEGVKLAAGWLIDQSGLKGKADNLSGVGCYERQALVLVNPLKASSEQVMDWAKHIQETVRDKFGVKLEPEPVHFS